MPRVIFIDADGLEHTIESDSGESLMAIAVNRGIPGIVAECGGNTACATCHVYLDEISFAALPPIAEHEEAMLDFTNSERRPTSRLSCQVFLTPAIDGAVIHIASN